MQLTNPLARVRGTGSAKDGTKHWWAQRLTAVALIPLTLWFAVSAIQMVSGDYASTRAAMSHPLTAALWVLFVVAVFHHAQLGLQVVIEDYVHDERVKIAALVIMKLLAVLVGTICVLAVLRVALGS